MIIFLHEHQHFEWCPHSWTFRITSTWSSANQAWCHTSTIRTRAHWLPHCHCDRGQSPIPCLLIPLCLETVEHMRSLCRHHELQLLGIGDLRFELLQLLKILGFPQFSKLWIPRKENPKRFRNNIQKTDLLHSWLRQNYQNSRSDRICT